MSKEDSQQKKDRELRHKAEKLLTNKTIPIQKLSTEEVLKLTYELQVQQIELEMQNEELHKIQVQIEKSQQKYAKLYDFAPLGYFTINEKGLILEVNQTGAAMLGLERNILIQKPLSNFISRNNQDIYYLHRMQAFETKKREVCELTMKKKDDFQFFARLESIAVQNSEGPFKQLYTIISNVTKWKQAEEKLQKLTQALEQSPVSVVITDTKGDIEYVNKKFTQVTGYTSEEAIGQNPRVLKSDDKTSGEYKELWETIRSGNEWRGEFSNKNREGKIYWESASISPIKNSNGDITHFIAVKEDISAQKQMEKIQKRSHFRIREINKLQQFLLGPGRLEVKLKKITDSVVELFDADFCRIWVIRPGDRCESGCMHALVTDGPHVCRYRDRCLHLLSSSGRYTHIDGDVHRRVPFGCYKIGLVAAGKEYKFLINGVTHDQRIHNNEWASELGLESFASYQLRPTGDEIIGILALFSKQTISAEDDELLEMLSYSTSQAIQSSRIEDLLNDSKKKLELLFSSIPYAVIELTSDNKINRWNDFAERIFGISASDILGQTFRESNILLDMDAITKILALCKENDNAVWTDDSRYKRTDGSEGLLTITVNPIKNEEDKQTGQIILMKDVTEHKQMEQQLAQAQKLESIGQLAAGVAHEINTPAQFISDNTFFIQDAFSKLSPLLKKYSHLLEMNKAGSVTPEMIREMDGAAKGVKLDYLTEEIPLAISEAQDGIKRVTEIVKSMKTFSHPDVKEKVYVDINTMIESTITVSRHEWKYVAEVETNLASDLPPAPCYPGEFNQVILNLIVNAAHAIGEVSGKGSEDKGKITISTHYNEGRVEVRISDTGTGIPENKRSRLFEPFFTTKEVGKGTGQGLAIAHAVIVKKHKGTISFESEIGKGTIFIIGLPLSHQMTRN
ncbi:MAG: PAS domain S-box protein [Candidatus Scalindua sp. AMX11]|nr:MAG: PAS domain S-box protein [Candidatus Scalindua sp. AMX11]